MLLVVIDAATRIWWSNRAFRDFADAGGGVLGDPVGRAAWDVLPVEIGLAVMSCLTAAPPGSNEPDIPDQVSADGSGRRRRVAWSLTRIDSSDVEGGLGWVLATGADVTRERTREATWRQRAQTDPLTGLANRAGAHDALRQCLDPLRRGVGCADLVCDVDGFKQINDSMGHVAGDEVLLQLGQRLSRLVRAQDTVARLGGDEFLLILPAVRADEDPLYLDHPHPSRLDVRVSIGLRTAAPGDDPGDVLHAADLAMYADRRRRRTDHTANDERTLVTPGDDHPMVNSVESDGSRCLRQRR